jgi:hypothetical protein
MAHGFTWNSKTNVYRTINLPGAEGTALLGINGNTIIGESETENFFLSNGTFVTFNVLGPEKGLPVGDVVTETSGMNSSGAIVGAYGNWFCCGVENGFLFENGIFTQIKFPNSSVFPTGIDVQGTTAFGIDPAGNIVGTFGPECALGAFRSNGYIRWHNAAAAKAGGDTGPIGKVSLEDCQP